VRFELQADCYVGVWTFYVQKRNLLDPGDLEEVPAAQTLGDTPKYGTAAQRLWWFKRGLATGDPRQCNTLIVSQP
jgi:predicted metalloprotease